MEYRMQTLRQFSRGIKTVRGPMTHRHKETRIWYAIIVDRRTTCTGSVLILRGRIMDSNTKIQHNNSGMYQKVQEGVHLRDSHNIRVIKGQR